MLLVAKFSVRSPVCCSAMPAHTHRRPEFYKEQQRELSHGSKINHYKYIIIVKPGQNFLTSQSRQLHGDCYTVTC